MAKASENNKLIVVNEHTLRDKVYVIRDQQVMLDSDLAEIYGYEVKNLNRQVKRNIERFPEDFMFQITKNELEELRCQNVTANIDPMSRSLPYVFTEQGIYQLATVLKGEIAARQSVAIMRVFRMMRQYIAQRRNLLPDEEVKQLADRQKKLESDVKEIKDTMVTKTDLSGFMELFDEGMRYEETLICEGQLLKADLVYQEIYKKAKNNIIVIDDYIGVKTLYHIAHAKTSVARTIITDNRGANPLRKTEYEDYLTEYPGKEIRFLKTNNKTHDRFIVADYGTKNVRAYLCGSSSKDSGKRVTMIMEMKDPENIKDTVEKFIHNPELKLK